MTVGTLLTGIVCQRAQAVVTWVSFTNLGENAWYPYPSLAIGAWPLMVNTLP